MDTIEFFQAQRAILSGLYNDALIILDSNPTLQDRAIWWHLKAIANYMRQRPAEALKEIGKALELEENEMERVKMLYDKALMLWMKGDMDKAVEMMKRLKSKLEYAILGLAVFYFLYGDIDSLASLLEEEEKVVHSTVIDGYLNYFRAIVDIYSGRPDKAYKHSLECYKSVPKFVGNTLLLISLLIKAGQLSKAEKLIDVTLSSGVEEIYQPYLYYFKGFIELLKPNGNLEIAEENLSIALRWDPENALYWFLLGILSLKKRRVDKANAYFKGAFVMDSSNPDYRTAYALSEALQGELDKALQILKRHGKKEIPKNVAALMEAITKAKGG